MDEWIASMENLQKFNCSEKAKKYRQDARERPWLTVIHFAICKMVLCKYIHFVFAKQSMLMLCAKRKHNAKTSSKSNFGLTTADINHCLFGKFLSMPNSFKMNWTKKTKQKSQSISQCFRALIQFWYFTDVFIRHLTALNILEMTSQQLSVRIMLFRNFVLPHGLSVISNFCCIHRIYSRHSNRMCRNK